MHHGMPGGKKSFLGYEHFLTPSQITTEKFDPTLKKGCYFQNKIFLLKISRISDRSGSLLICILVETNSLTSKNLNKVLRSYTNEKELAS